jgi:hypothetical protein
MALLIDILILDAQQRLRLLDELKESSEQLFPSRGLHQGARLSTT